jgi:hypothetical protein
VKGEKMTAPSAIRAEVVVATKEIVDALLAINTGNRGIRENVVSAYRRDIEAGHWVLTNQGIGVMGDYDKLIDGQHRLEALKGAGYPPVQLLIVSGLQDEAQIHVDQQAKRSSRDVMALVFNERVHRAAPSVTNILIRMYYKSSCKSGRITVSEQLDILEMHRDEIQSVIERPRNNSFFSAPFLGGFVACMIEAKDRKDDVLEFMDMVETGEMLRHDMPAFHLRNLITLKRGVTGGATIQTERYAKTLRAVTAHLSGASMLQLRA